MVKRGLWPRPFSPLVVRVALRLAASPDLLNSFIIFRAAPLGRVALTCPRPLRGCRGQLLLRARALCRKLRNEFCFRNSSPQFSPLQFPSAKGGGGVTVIPLPHTARV